MPEVRLDHGQRLPIGLKSLDTASSRLDQETSPLAGGIAIQSQALSRIGQRLPKALGLTIPPSMLLRAHEVIE